MSKINAIRIINLYYNHNTMKIDDEYFELNGENTLFALQNGGGKSVLVQMLIAPFVHKRFRNTADRPFSSFFTTNRPTFILVEWKLEGSDKYVLTGFMVRKNQENKEDHTEDLEIISIIHEYLLPHTYDIRNFPVIEEEGGTKQLKGFQSCKKLFEDLKQKNAGYFNYYDINNASHQRNYFDKLKQYQIDYKEWESIIKRINLKESGLSELFVEAKDEYGLVDKWFLTTIEEKLNKEENRIHQFELIIGKYIKQYKENRSKFERKEQIIKFKQDTISVYETANNYHKIILEKEAIEQKIAALINMLFLLKEGMEQEKEVFYSGIEEDLKQLREVHYEIDSLQIHEKEDLLSQSKEKEQVKKILLEVLESEILKTVKKQHILLCAKYFADYQRDSKEVQKIENNLEIARQKDQDLLPERNQIGYNLRIYYEKEELLQKEEISAIEQQIAKAQEDSNHLVQERGSLSKIQMEERQKLGGLLKEIKQYDLQEGIYNQRYQESFARNILGFYETGYLERMEGEIKKQIEGTGKKINEEKSRSYEIDLQVQRENRDVEDFQNQLGSMKSKLNMEEQLMKEYLEQLEVRKSLLSLLTLTESDRFHSAKLISLFDQKMEEINQSIQQRLREVEELKKQYKRLESGELLELSKEMEEALKEKGIHSVYGMDWLKKNSYSLKENKKIVENNPFLPYSLIMSKRECDKLLKAKIEVFTSFPIPIVLREGLENSKNRNISDKGNSDERDSDKRSTDERNSDKGKSDESRERKHLLLFQDFATKFYIYFNDHLLDEQELESMLLNLKHQMDSIHEIMQRRQEERSFYQAKRDVLQRQNVTEEGFKKCEKSIKTLTEDLNKKETLMALTKDRIAKLMTEKKQKEAVIKELEHFLISLKQKQLDFSRLKEQYLIYVNANDERKVLEKQLEEREQELIKVIEEDFIKQEEIREKREERSVKKRRFEDISKKVVSYISYKNGEILNKDIEDLEARYEAITSQIGGQQKLLEEQLIQANERFKSSEEALLHYSKKYQIREIEYKEVTYDRFAEEELERHVEKLEKDHKDLKKQENKLATEVAVMENELKRDKKNFKVTYQTEELKPKEEIVIRDFKAQIVAITLQKEEKEEKLKKTLERLSLYNDNLSILAEYDHFVCKTEISFEEPLSSFQKKDWDQFRGKILRDYKQLDKEASNHRQYLSEGLQIVLNEKAFADEFYHNPLVHLYELRTMPRDFMEQLELVWGSYENLLEKLEIDIAFLGAEKEKIIEILLDYVKDVHHQLDIIDRNSSIPIRERSIRMLRIKLPNWEEQEEVYKLRMKDFLEGLFAKGLVLLDKNEQIEEMLGKQIATRYLYDRVIGIGNVEIKLYKIEEQKEYPITWAEVAKNSGGEGFLSAFVILSSLLSFMRKEESDIFSEREESKVLIMDNPFAQTSSAHLLKPLMEVAKKTNTQLICLSGLSGDSIYNRFDQIFVLNLVYSRLRSGMSYLHSDHVKGEEVTRQLISSKVLVEDVEQLMLF